MSRGRIVLLLVGIVWMWAASSAASDDPNNSRGFSADNLYQFGELDTVDLFNGNLTLVLPIGQSYPINAGFDYRLNLVYNSNVWDFGQRPGPIPSDGPRPIYTVARYGYQFNAGLGWRLSLGELRVPETAPNASNQIVYVGSDGASHAFWPTLHEGEPSVPNVRYTRDGSYIRLTAPPGGDVLSATEVTLDVSVVQSYDREGSSRPKAEKETDKLVSVKVEAEPIRQGAFGVRSGDGVTISSAKAPEGEAEQMNFLTNVVAHEVGHASDALPQYSGDAAPVGSIMNPWANQPEEGSTMETRISAEELGENVRSFSEEDKHKLREALNED